MAEHDLEVRKKIFDIPVVSNSGKGKRRIAEKERKEENVAIENVATVIVIVNANGIEETVIVGIVVNVEIRKGKEVAHLEKDVKEEIEIEVIGVGIVTEVIVKIEEEATARSVGEAIAKNVIEVKGMESARSENEGKRVIVNEVIGKVEEIEMMLRASDAVNVTVVTRRKTMRTRIIITITTSHGRWKMGKSNRKNQIRTIIVNVGTTKATHQIMERMMTELSAKKAPA